MCSGKTVKSSKSGLVTMNGFEEIHGGGRGEEEENEIVCFPTATESFLSSAPSILR